MGYIGLIPNNKTDPIGWLIIPESVSLFFSGLVIYRINYIEFLVNNEDDVGNIDENDSNIISFVDLENRDITDSHNASGINNFGANSMAYSTGFGRNDADSVHLNIPLNTQLPSIFRERILPSNYIRR